MDRRRSADSSNRRRRFAGPVAPGASVSATFKVTSGPAAFNGDLVGQRLMDQPGQRRKAIRDSAAKKCATPARSRSTSSASAPVLPPTQPTRSSSSTTPATSSVDISNWTLTEHPTQQAIFSTVKIPAGTSLAAHGFYLLGLSNSGLAVHRPRRRHHHLRPQHSRNERRRHGHASAPAPARRPAKSPASAPRPATTPRCGSRCPTVRSSPFPPAQPTSPSPAPPASWSARRSPSVTAQPTPPSRKPRSSYEVATVTAVGKPGTQAYLAADAPPAQPTSRSPPSPTSPPVTRSASTSTASATASRPSRSPTSARRRAHQARGEMPAPAQPTSRFATPTALLSGDKITIGTPANKETVTITAVGTCGPRGAGIDFTPALDQAHIGDEGVVEPGTGLDLAAPLKFNHAANLPFSDRGTGITFQPATAFAHSSNEPIQALGTGITLVQPAGQRSRNRRRGARRRGHHRRLPGHARAQPVVRRPRLSPPVAVSSATHRHAESRQHGAARRLPVSSSTASTTAASSIPGLPRATRPLPEQAKGGCYVTAPGAAGGFGPFASAPMQPIPARAASPTARHRQQLHRFPDLSPPPRCRSPRPPAQPTSRLPAWKASAPATTIRIDTAQTSRPPSSPRWAPRALPRGRCHRRRRDEIPVANSHGFSGRRDRGHWKWLRL